MRRQADCGRPKPGSGKVKSSQGGSANFMFCDGHAESIKQDFAVSRNPTMRKRWNADNEAHIGQ
jgi:prepilin-type processing-associated H-X9-DG protein